MISGDLKQIVLMFFYNFFENFSCSARCSYALAVPPNLNLMNYPEGTKIHVPYPYWAIWWMSIRKAPQNMSIAHKVHCFIFTSSHLV